ncbi:MAG: hypothetical protein HON43_07955 [Alphaproteobacteria bacterium]|jgi:hypothetical protein|nr:hypothetical protein [Alphaproteobacteria bacterium]MBT5390699.1 hypothetical protein [Alphaproteobacteria bacterium]MBT5540695.1 hypothetical protein [Alphaproteobacteria bacterium]
MSNWLQKFLQKEGRNRTDKPDKRKKKIDLSVLSVPSQDLFDKNLENVPRSLTDKPDKCKKKIDLSVLSVPTQGTFDENLENESEGLIGNASLIYNFEERCAISEYDGHISPIEARRIAYQDAFIDVLNALPYKHTKANYEKDWLEKRIKAAQAWLLAQGLRKFGEEFRNITTQSTLSQNL